MYSNSTSVVECGTELALGLIEPFWELKYMLVACGDMDDIGMLGGTIRATTHLARSDVLA